MAELEKCKAGTSSTNDELSRIETETKEMCERRIDQMSCMDKDDETCKKDKADKKTKECRNASSSDKPSVNVKKNEGSATDNSNMNKESKDECEERIQEEVCKEKETEEECMKRKTEKKKKCRNMPPSAPDASNTDTQSTTTENPIPQTPSPSVGGSEENGDAPPPPEEEDAPIENTFVARLKNDGELFHGGARKRSRTTRKARTTRRNKARNTSRRKRPTKPTEP